MDLSLVILVATGLSAGIAGLAIVIGTRLALSSQIALFAISNIYVAGSCLILTLALKALVVWRRQRELMFPNSILFLWGLWATGVMLSASINGVNSRMLFQSFEFASYGATIVLVSIVARHFDLQLSLLWAASIGATALSVMMMYAGWLLSDWMPGLVGRNEGSFVLTMFGVIPVIILFTSSPRVDKRLILLGILVSCIMAIWAAESRSSLLTTIVLLLAGVLLAWLRQRIWLLALVLPPVVLLAFWSGFDTDSIFLEQGFDRDFSIQERLGMMAASYRLYLEAPLVGWGAGSVEFMMRSQPEFSESSPHPHNTYAQFAVELGGLGLIFVVALYGVLAARGMGFLAITTERATSNMPMMAAVAATRKRFSISSGHPWDLNSLRVRAAMLSFLVAIALIMQSMFDALFYGAQRGYVAAVMIGLAYSYPLRLKGIFPERALMERQGTFRSALPTRFVLVALASLALAPSWYALDGDWAAMRSWLDPMHQMLLAVVLAINAARFGLRAVTRALPVMAVLALLGISLLGAIAGEFRLSGGVMLVAALGLALPWCCGHVLFEFGARRTYALVIVWIPVLSVLSGVMVEIIGLHSLFSVSYGMLRLQGASNAGWLGFLAFAGVVIGGHEMLRTDDKWFGGATLVNLAILILTGSRTPLVAAAVMAVVYVLMTPAAVARLRALGGSSVHLVVVALGGLGVVLAMVLPGLLTRTFGAGGDIVRLSGRESVWLDALTRFLESPVFGHGLGSTLVGKTYGELPHNEYLRLLVDSGLVGLSLFVGAAVFWFVQLYNMVSPGDRGYVAAFGASLAVYALADNVFVMPPMLVAFVYLGVMATPSPEPMWATPQRNPTTIG